MGSTSKRCLRFCAALLAAWLGLRLVLPLMYPFLLGTLLALGAEGAADFLERRPCPPLRPPSGPGWRCWRTGSCPWGPVCQATGRP